MPTPAPVGARDGRSPIDCQQCVLLRICTSIPDAYSVTECDKALARRRRSLTPGAVLYREGDPVRGIFVVRAGALKLSNVASSGEEVVIGFALPGEPAGLEALAGHRYQRHATALRSVAYCEIPIRWFLRAVGGAPRHCRLSWLVPGDGEPRAAGPVPAWPDCRPGPRRATTGFQSVGVSGVRRSGIRAPADVVTQAGQRRNTRLALVPPKPKLFDMATFGPGVPSLRSTGKPAASASSSSIFADAAMKWPCIMSRQ